MAPLVSVVIPTFNRAAIVGRSVACVTAQSWRPIELIVVNDGSTDATREFLDALKPSGIDFQAIHKPHSGAAGARNAGVDAAIGEYFAFLDDDDNWRPDKLEKQMAELAKTGAEACCCLVTREHSRRKRAPATPEELPRGRDAARIVSRRATANILSLVVRRELWQRVGRFDESLRVYEDAEWIARLAHEATFCAVPEELATYTYSTDSLRHFSGEEQSAARDADFMRHLHLVRERCASRPGWSEQAWKELAAHVYDECAKHRLYAGDLAGARELYAQALELCGPIMALPKLRTKLRKAWWLSLLGLKPRHPKLRRGEVIHG